MNFIPHFDEVEFKPIDLDQVNFENQKIYLHLFLEIQRFQRNIFSINKLINLFKIQKNGNHVQ